MKTVRRYCHEYGKVTLWEYDEDYNVNDEDWYKCSGCGEHNIFLPEEGKIVTWFKNLFK